MTETKADLQVEVDRLQAENEQLRGQLAVATAGGGRPVQAAARRPHLSEGERQELELRGVVNSPFTGERLTRDQVLEELAGSDTQAGVEIAEPDPAVAAAAGVPAERKREPIEGVDFIYPSVAPGVLAAGDARPLAQA